MRTPWGDLSIADAHVHFFSYGFFSALARQKGLEPNGSAVKAIGETTGWEMPPAEAGVLAERWAGELDRHGLERSVLIASVPGDEDSVAAAAGRFPERFIGYFMLDPTSPGAAARAEQAVVSRGLAGICLFPAMHLYSMHDPRVREILKIAASRPGCVIFVHCGVLTVGVRKKLGLASRFDLRYSNPIDLHALALEYTGVPFVIPHFGAGYFREALMVADLCPNVYLDTSSTNSWMRYQEAGCDLKSVFRRALDVLGPERLLFGTDSSFFPRGWQRAIFDEQVAALGEIGISQAAARAIFGDNLLRLTNPKTRGQTEPSPNLI